MSAQVTARPIEILLVEDNQGDARLTHEALRDSRVLNRLNHVKDGVEALAYLRKERAYADVSRPDLILLDLNLPRMDGRELLAIVKEDAALQRIPVVVLTTSQAEEDILRSYELRANAYVTKPVAFAEFLSAVRALEEFWLSIVIFPVR